MRQITKGIVRRAMHITVAEQLEALANKVPTLCRDFVGIFGKVTEANLLAYRPQDICINLEAGKQPPSEKLYPLSSDELELLKEYLKKLLRNGKISPSQSSARAPILFAK